MRLVATILAVACVTSGIRALALDCPRPPVPSITVELASEPVTLDRGKSAADLSRMRGPSPRHQTRGLYVATLHSQLEIGYVSASDGRRACVTVDRVVARVGLRRRVIHVAREFPAGSCESNAVLDHERRHQATDDNLLAREIAGLKAHLSEATRTAHAGPIGNGEIGRAQARIKQELGEAFRQATEAINNRREAAQAAVDSKAEYAFVQGRCPDGWRN